MGAIVRLSYMIWRHCMSYELWIIIINIAISISLVVLVKANNIPFSQDMQGDLLVKTVRGEGITPHNHYRVSLTIKGLATLAPLHPRTSWRYINDFTYLLTTPSLSIAHYYVKPIPLPSQIPHIHTHTHTPCTFIISHGVGAVFCDAQHIACQFTLLYDKIRWIMP